MLAENNKEEFLIFKLGNEEYAIDIHKVQEIRSYESPTVIADQPKYMKGVINLRGSIVPVLDLRLKLNMEQVTYDSFTVVVILSYKNKILGVVVDSVSDVVTLNESQIQSSNGMEQFSDINYLKGIGMVDERMLQIIEINTFIDQLGKDNSEGLST